MWLLRTKHCLRARHYAKCSVLNLILIMTWGVGATLLLDLQMWELRPRVVKSLARSHTAGKREIRIHTRAADSNTSSDLLPSLLCTMSGESSLSTPGSMQHGRALLTASLWASHSTAQSLRVLICCMNTCIPTRKPPTL